MTASQRKPRSREGVFFAKEIALTKAGWVGKVGWMLSIRHWEEEGIGLRGNETGKVIRDVVMEKLMC